MFVIDASAAVKWSVEEEYCTDPLRLLDLSEELIAPDFILLECSSALQKKYGLVSYNIKKHGVHILQYLKTVL